MSTFTLTARQMSALQDISEAANDWRKAMTDAGSRIEKALDPNHASRWDNEFAISDIQKAAAATIKFEATLPVLRLIAPDKEAAAELERMARTGELYEWFWHGKGLQFTGDTYEVTL